MSAGRIISYILAALFIVFGAIMVLGSVDPDQGQIIWLPIGVVFMIIGLILVWLGYRQKTKPAEVSVTLQIDLPADINLDTLKCQKCGGSLTTENISMVAGAPVIDCPYCGTTYQITEEPKW